MNFLKKISQTKKIKNLKKDLKKAVKKLDEKYSIGEKLEGKKNTLKKKYQKIDKKYLKKNKEKISEKMEDVGEKIIDILDEKISFEDFEKVEVRIGEILEVEKIEKSDKLLKLIVDLGEKENRQIISGIAKFYKNPEKELVGKQSLFVSNLAPRKIFGHESDGMIFALKDSENFSIVSPNMKIKNGTLAG